ncbi:MAG: phosphate regulon sensor histidine kinase PhoR [Spongiibacteraceae bacterium]|jgi:two-component system phosphate regulon sensor histidine kinase PhoR|nr:phosphate regulon sensor histidine kinase PhoR [Spongiibacteraceae bacterium]
MRNPSWRTELTLLAALLMAGLLAGWLLGRPALGAAIGATLFGLRAIANLRSLHTWLTQNVDSEPPEARGLWGDLFDALYRLQRRGRSERERLRRLVDYMRESFSSLPYGAVMLDPEANIEWSNRAAERLLGLRYPEDMGQQLLNLLRSPEFVAYFEAEDYSKPLEMASPAQASRWLEIQLTFFGKRSRLLFVRDVTQTHKLEAMRKDFVANVSHELRTPLTVISGYLETFADNPDQLPPRLHRAVDQMLQQSRRMEGLISDLLLLSRLETVPQKEEQVPLALRPLLEALADDARTATSGERTITIEADDSLLLVGQEDEIRSICANLVFNAARYTQPGGRIMLRWYADLDAGYLQVEDDGCGIAPAHIPRLTERFYRVDDSRSMDTGGTGLGLAIVKHALLRHQGRLHISSEPGKGSCFTCVFPRERLVTR